MPLLSPRTLAVLVGFLPLVSRAVDPAPSATPAAPTADIRTPPAPTRPRINGPRIYGARPGHPFLYHLPVTGERPMTFSAKGLPAGLVLDANTGNIKGATTDRGTHPVEFTAANAQGDDHATINLVIGDMICLTPPLGWNSWNHFAHDVSEANVRAAADAMVASGLIEHGWTYINIDDCWQGERDPEGNIQGNAKFPDLKALGDYIHGKGLKYGIYSSPGPKTCAGFKASYQHEDQDAQTYGGWGVDYVKYDLCSYRAVMLLRIHQRVAAFLPPAQQPVYAALTKEQDELLHTSKRTPEQDARLKDVNTEIGKMVATVDAAHVKAINLDENEIPYRVFGQSLAKVPRDIVYSLCQYGIENVWEWGASVGGNCWRTTGDIKANWRSMSSIGFIDKDDRAKDAGPGHWNDPDMLEIGNEGLTPDECYTHMTLWCMLSAPLLIGCDMSKMDPLTVSLFSNDEVLAVNQDALGEQGYRLKVDSTSEVWIKPLAGAMLAVALFNRGDTAADIGVPWNELARFESEPLQSSGLPPHLRDLWRQQPISFSPKGMTMRVAPHGAELLRVSL